MTTLDRLVSRQAALRPAAPAVVAPDHRLSYAELVTQASAIALGLQRFLAGDQDRDPRRQPVFGLAADRTGLWVVAAIACWKAGAAYLPIDLDWPARRSLAILEDARVTAALVDEAGGRAIHGLSPTPVLPLEGLARDNPPRTLLESAAAPEALAYVVYTSGSTGTPKGVGIEHRNLLAYVRGFGERVSLAEAPSWAVVSTLAADLAYTALYPPLAGGGTVHLLPKPLALDGPGLARYLERERVAGLKITPGHMAALMGGGQHPPMPEKSLVLGGEPLEPSLVERLRADAPGRSIFNHYGPAEATIGVCTYRCPSAPPPGGSVPIGRPFAGTSLHLLDEEGRPVRDGDAGELYVEGPSVGRGYLGRPDLTRERFADPGQGQSGLRTYRTGDLAVRLPDGNVRFLGRKDNQVKVRGYRVELEEVEAAVKAHPQVGDCAAVTEPGADERPLLIAYLTSRSGDARLVGELRTWVKARLPDFMVPTDFRVLGALPRLANGKLDRRRLSGFRAHVRSAPERDGGSGPADLTGTVLAIWREVLNSHAVRATDDFFAVGGDSLMAVQIAARVAERLQIEVPIADLFLYATPEQLAERLGQIGP